MRKAPTVVLMGLLALSGVACGADSSGTKAVKKKDPAKAVIKKAEPKADSVKSRGVMLPKLVDLGADKCMPCRMMAPILDELKKDYAEKFEVVFIDVWKNAEEGGKFRIRFIPTQIFYDPDGKELYRHEGFYSKEDILRKWKELGHDMTK